MITRLKSAMDITEPLRTDGYCHLRGFFGPAEIERVESDIFAVVCGLSASLGAASPAAFRPGAVDRAVVELVRRFPQAQGVLYDRLQQMPSLLAFPAMDNILALAAAGLGSERVGVWPRTQLRMDLPQDAVNLIRWHNDYMYNRGTAASLTFWFPLVDAVPEMGPLMFARGSHLLALEPVRTGGPERFDYDLPREIVEGLDVVTPPAARGDLVVFHSRLWHSGQLNRSSDRARLSGLFRLQDLNTVEVSTPHE